MVALALTVTLLALPKDPPKILAQTTIAISGGSAVIRNDRDLGRHNLSSAPTTQVKARLAKTLEVEGIDWDKHLVVCISGGKQKKGGMSVELKSPEVKGGKLVVNWNYNETEGDAEQFYPELVLLLDRFDGDVVFDPVPTLITSGDLFPCLAPAALGPS